MLTREVWPQQETKDALAKVVCLAVHRYEKDPARPKDHPPSPWAIRFGVVAYPQFRFIDGHGRQLAVENGVGRHAKGMAAAVERALRAFEAPERGQAYCHDPAGGPPRARPESGADRGWFAQADAVERLACLAALAATLPEERQAILDLALRGDNDWVRIKALEVVTSADGAAATVVGEMVDAAASGRSAYPNPNNVLMAAVQAAGRIADPSLVPALGRVLERQSANNVATLYATEALIAIGKAHGRERVASVLAVASKLEGNLAVRIRKLVEGYEHDGRLP